MKRVATLVLMCAVLLCGAVTASAQDIVLSQICGVSLSPDATLAEVCADQVAVQKASRPAGLAAPAEARPAIPPASFCPAGEYLSALALPQDCYNAPAATQATFRPAGLAAPVAAKAPAAPDYCGIVASSGPVDLPMECRK